MNEVPDFLSLSSKFSCSSPSSATPLPSSSSEACVEVARVVALNWRNSSAYRSKKDLLLHVLLLAVVLLKVFNGC
jgi:hypothetical protein